MMRFLFVFLFLTPTFLIAQINNSEVFKIVEEMPQFEDCGAIKVLPRSDCFQNYICNNLQYPELARKNGVRGEVIITFVIGKTGAVENARITQDIGAECGTTVLEFVNNMPDWIPGKQRGIIVPVQYKLKVDYRIFEETCR